MTKEKAVVEELRSFGETRGRTDWDALDPETESLVRRNPFALLIAVAFDRGMVWTKAWRIPTEIHRKGLLDPEHLASMSESELIDLMESLPIRPRYGSRNGAKTILDVAHTVQFKFGGDAAAAWRQSSPAEVEKTLQEIHGVGPGIASMTTRILHDDFGYFKGYERQIDVKPDVHVLRVFYRTGLIDSESSHQAMHQAIQVSRKLNPEFPAALDWPAWRIGQIWCHATRPMCDECVLTEHCAKRG